jgi:Ni,Fe-hydrogenase I small subunit
MTLFAPKGGPAGNGSAELSEVRVLWLTAGLGCDGDTIAVTAATQPSLEDLILGTFPWVPKIRFHNPFLAFENGDEAAARRNIQAVRPGMKVFTLSAKTGAGMPAFLAFLEGCRSSSRAAL